METIRRVAYIPDTDNRELPAREHCVTRMRLSLSLLRARANGRLMTFGNEFHAASAAHCEKGCVRLCMRV